MDADNENYPKIAAAFIEVGVNFPSLLKAGFARILDELEIKWTTEEAITYLDSLMMGSREDRQGFPIAVLSELSLLKQVHDYFYPEFKNSDFDPFSFGSTGLPIDTKLLPLNPINKPATHARTQAHGSDKVTSQHKRIAWPVIMTQHDLSVAAEALHQGKNYFELQGKHIGEILHALGVVDDKTLNEIGKKIDSKNLGTSKPTGQLLIEAGKLSAEDLTRALCIQSGVLMVDVLNLDIPRSTLKVLPSPVARAKRAIPVGVFNRTLFLAVAEPFSYMDQQYIAFSTGMTVVLVYATQHDITNRLDMYGMGSSKPELREEFKKLADKSVEAHHATEKSSVMEMVSENDAIIINLVNKIFANAVDEGASDIHIELFQNEQRSRVRFRRDGNLEHFGDFPAAYHDAVISRIKIMARLDISVKKKPQDGKISLRLPSGTPIDLRISTIPVALNKEYVTIRLLPAGKPVRLETLGMLPREVSAFREIFKQPYGLILVCGPTGSGKTTTLHSVLSELNIESKKIWTVEDPVEVVQSNLCQVQVNEKSGMTFNSVLRAFLRADPDIIMVGEMRDAETAKIAIEASMTGHLVLSTLHTNSSAETVSRLVDLGIDVFNLSDALLAIMAQRLARRLCAACAKKEEASQSELEDMAIEYFFSAKGKTPGIRERDEIIKQWRSVYGDGKEIHLSKPVGCPSCNAGYKGVIGLYELLRASPQVKNLVRNHAPAQEYLDIGVSEGMVTLKQNGIERVLAGLTDMAQIRSACS